jgi:hypothetical protein
MAHTADLAIRHVFAKGGTRQIRRDSPGWLWCPRAEHQDVDQATTDESGKGMTPRSDHEEATGSLGNFQVKIHLK